jgi:hypothetical protein
MKCQCQATMSLSAVYDTGSSGESFAWNLWSCQSCGMVARENVWDSTGVVWVPREAPPCVVSGGSGTCLPPAPGTR